MEDHVSLAEDSQRGMNGIVMVQFKRKVHSKQTKIQHYWGIIS